MWTGVGSTGVCTGAGAGTGFRAAGFFAGFAAGFGATFFAIGLATFFAVAFFLAASFGLAAFFAAAFGLAFATPFFAVLAATFFAGLLLPFADFFALAMIASDASAARLRGNAAPIGALNPPGRANPPKSRHPPSQPSAESLQPANLRQFRFLEQIARPVKPAKSLRPVNRGAAFRRYTGKPRESPVECEGRHAVEVGCAGDVPGPDVGGMRRRLPSARFPPGGARRNPVGTRNQPHDSPPSPRGMAGSLPAVFAAALHSRIPRRLPR